MTKNINIERNISLLIKIQTVAKDLFVMEQEISKKHEMLNKAKNDYEAATTTHKNIQEEIKSIASSIKEYEKEIETHIEKVNLLKNKEKLITTQKEYIALDTEINLNRESIVEFEAKIGKQQIETETLNKRLAESQTELDKIKESYKTKETELNIELDTSKESVESARKVKQEITPQIDRYILTRYENIVKNKDGVGIVPVIIGNCEGCNIRITPHIMSKLIRNKEIIYCSNCARILYLMNKDTRMSANI